jgi:phage-related baseplate assembly protein
MALPLFDPAHPTVETPGVVTVIAMPKGGGELSPALRDAIRAYLDERRLVTARVFVNHPDYVPIVVEAIVAKTPEANADDVRAKAVATLIEFLDPEFGGDPGMAADYVEGLSQDRGPGWSFGRSIYVSELYEILERVRGVDHVETISAPTAAVPLERDQLPTPGAHVITVV